MSALRTLLHGIVDYAGLFPPAALDMAQAARCYATYLGGPDRWALGRFVVPAARLPELERAASELLPRGGSVARWRLSALVGPRLDDDIAAVRDFNARHADGSHHGEAVIDAIELKAATEDEIARVAGSVPARVDAYVEIPVDGDPRPLVDAIARAGLRAKVRTGGTVAALVPSSDELLRFLVACTAASVPFKATAGLHHPLRGEYRLTYEPDSATGTMFGFLNVFLAAALLRAGLAPDEARDVLEERSPAAFHFDPAGVAWRGHQLDVGALADARVAAVAFGSCSFREPLDDLQALRLL